MRFPFSLTLLAVSSLVLVGAVADAGQSTKESSPAAVPTVEYRIVEQWNIGGDGGYGRVIVVDPAQRSEKGLLALADQLRRDTSEDRNAVVYIYDDATAAKMRKDAGNEKLRYADLKWHDDHMIGIYSRIANRSYHAMTMYLEGASGWAKEVALP